MRPVVHTIHSVFDRVAHDRSCGVLWIAYLADEYGRIDLLEFAAAATHSSPDNVVTPQNVERDARADTREGRASGNSVEFAVAWARST